MLEATRKNHDKCKIDSKEMLHGWVAGIPFPYPKRGIEMAWNFDKITVSSENLRFQPIHFILFNRHGEKERTLMGELFWKKYQGRVDVPPFGNISEDIFEKGAVVFTYPFDIKGFVGVRTRFVAPNKPDYFITWIPSLRRTRLMSGTDTQDPMLGTDVMWDDWKGHWQKISPDIYPNEYKFLGSKVILTPTFRDYRDWRLEGNKLYSSWELSPVWVYEAVSKDKSYQYSIRRLWLDKEIFRGRYTEYFDTRDNLWRQWTSDALSWAPETGFFTTNWAEQVDHVNKHRTFVYMDSIANDPTVTEDMFNIRILQKMH